MPGRLLSTLALAALLLAAAETPAHAARTAAAGADGRLEAFLVGADGALYRTTQTSQAPDAWSPFTSLGGSLSPGPVGVARTPDGRVHVIARGADNAIWQLTQAAPNGGFGGWSSLGGELGGSPEVTNNADGRLEFFVRGTNNVAYHRAQAIDGTWAGWRDFGGTVLGDMSVVANPDGRMEAFARRTDLALGTSWQKAPNAGWDAWTSRGGTLASDPAAAANADGRLEVFARGTNNALYHILQAEPGVKWGDWASLGGNLEGTPAVARDAAGELHVFARAGDNTLWHIWQTGGGWSAWTPTGTRIVGDPALALDGFGRLHVFVLGPDGGLLHSFQSGPATWSPAVSLGRPEPPGTPAPPTPRATPHRIVVSLAFSYSAGKRSTRIKRLTVKLVPRGATVNATCSKGCSRKRLVTRNARKSNISLTKLVRKPLRVGRKITVTVSQPGAIAAVKTLKIRKRRSPSVATRCLPPEAKSPRHC